MSINTFTKSEDKIYNDIVMECYLEVYNNKGLEIEYTNDIPDKVVKRLENENFKVFKGRKYVICWK